MCRILLTEGIFGCDVIFRAFLEWEPALYSSTAGAERKREFELYRDPDKDRSHGQVSRAGQLNTREWPFNPCTPLGETDLGRPNGGWGDVKRALSQGFLSLEAAGVLKMAKQVQDQQTVRIVNCANIQACLLWVLMDYLSMLYLLSWRNSLFKHRTRQLPLWRELGEIRSRVK